MLTLLTEARFWTTRDDIVIKDTDFGAFRYLDKKETANANTQSFGKRNYAERRDLQCLLDNKHPTKLKNCIRKLEDYLKHFKIVYCRWRDNAVIQLVLSNGLLVHICINIFTGDITRMAFDKFFVGKLISDQITDVVLTRMHAIIAYAQNQLTFVYLQKPNMKRSAPEKISRMDPKIFNVIINGPTRTIPRHLACNYSFDLLVVWTKSSQNEVYPWRPTVRDQDRANVHVYKISRTKLESLCYYWTENDPINVEFRTNQNQLHSVEQKISRKGEVTIEICMYEINKSKLQRTSVTSIPLQTQVCCQSLSPDNEKLMLGCIDGSVVIFDEGRGITHLVKAAFIPTIISWHCDSALIVIANERCQFQCFDISLACVKNQLISEDMTPSNLLDLSSYFTTQPTLVNICWSKKPDLALHNERFAQSDCFLLLCFENGPLACLRFFSGCGLKGDVHTSGFTADVLIQQYLNLNHIEKAINLLLCMNWDTYGAMCLISMHKIANYIFQRPLTPEREVQLQKTLGSFHVPVKPLAEETEAQFGDQVRDITRKFFQYLLRFKSYEKAFSLAIDINDEDLFMDLYNCAKLNGNVDLAGDAFRKAEEILTRPESVNSMHSMCSHSSCSECIESSICDSEASSKTHEVNENILNNNPAPSTSSSSPSSPRTNLISNVQVKEHPPLPTFAHQKQNVLATNSKPYVPPLPYLSHPNRPSDVRIPKPELKVSSFSKNQQKNPNSRSRYQPSTHLIASDNILLVDPPLPLLKKTSSQDNLFQSYARTPDRNAIYHNSFSTDGLNNVGNYDDIKRITFSANKSSKMPKNLPRNVAANHKSVVIDVVPKPTTSSMTTNSDWKVPAQTVGIPLTFSHNNNIPYASPFQHRPLPYLLPPGVPLTHQRLMKAESMYNMTPPLPPPIIHQHPLISGNIPSIASIMPDTYNPKKLPSTLGGKKMNATSSILSGQGQQSTMNVKKEMSEKNKVKFSDTVTVAVVPEISRKDKQQNDRIKRPNGFHKLMTDPQRELADSLPLCHPNDEYLKDFTPMSDDKKDDDESNRSGGGSTIKVVHFGVV
ncbi:WD repeat-containing and planar cell polarity effector protein fritz [Pseudolycoriella hygida]|uniref:WD repeat-containing and planar cell polarity effector protein fritz n=1 Tax=Pseudolycoriella hygida TaxID=35572 RepID=A0A9Q0NAM2_9DIPT|nr:WD repeat-containing and planar cell polarity effector protein fritz [Pseudolycoriella hygida]